MNYYLVKTAHGNMLKNKLEKAVYECLKTQDRNMIAADKLSDFKAGLQAEIEQLNAQHPRCKPIEIKFWSPNKAIESGPQDFHLCGFAGIELSLLECKEIKA